MIQNTHPSAKSASPGAKLATPLQIGAVTLANRVFLAPMSGVSDIVFRSLAQKAGAGMVVSEMVASAEFCQRDGKSSMRASGGDLVNHVVQLAGREAFWMGEAAKRAQDEGAAMIDINMGCPAKKVTGGYSGSALMRDLDHAMSLIDATLKAVTVPVTLKMRLGWDTGSINAPELARRAEESGIAMVTVHGRTRCQFYQGTADWDAVRLVRQAVCVPLVVNGDIGNLTDACKALDRSGADAVMLGRATCGMPWLAGAIAQQAAGSDHDTGHPGPQLTDYVTAHYEAMLSLYGREPGLRHARKHLGWYLDKHASGIPKALKQNILTGTEPDGVLRLLGQAFSGEMQQAEPGQIAA